MGLALKLGLGLVLELRLVLRDKTEKPVISVGHKQT